MKTPITYGEYVGPDGVPVMVPEIPPDATPEEIESIVLAEGAAAMTDEQDQALQERLNAGVRRGKAR